MVEKSFKTILRRHEDGLNTLRKATRKHDWRKMLPIIHRRLQEIKDNIKLQQQSPIYVLMQIAKWNVQYYNSFYDKKNFKGWNTVARICNLYLDVFPKCPLLAHLLEEGYDRTNYMVMQTSQQFPFQSQPSITELGRAIWLFCKAHCRFDTDRALKKITGVGAEDFIKLCFGSWILAQKGVVPVSMATPGTASWLDRSTAASFFEFMSFDEGSFKTYCNENDPSNPTYALFWPSPFQERPFIRVEKELYLSPFPGFVLAKAAYGIYDALKREHKNAFTECFGETFEKHIANVLDVVRPQFVDILKGEQIARPSGMQAPDFVLFDNDTVLLVEAKGVEMDRVVAKEELIRQNLRDNVIKGLGQCLTFTHYLRKNANPEVKHLVNKRIVSLVVSFKPIYLTNTPFYWDRVFRPTLEEAGFGNLHNEFDYQVIGVTQLEQIIGLSVNSSTPLRDILLHKLDVNDNRYADFGPFLRQYVEEKGLPQRYDLPVISQSFRDLTDEMKNDLPG